MRVLGGGTARLGALVVVLALATGPAPAPALSGHRTADVPRTGYRIPADGTAAGGWIGSRGLGRAVVYRIDPGRRPTVVRFRPARWRTVLAGSGPRPVTRLATRRAAWLLSKYGTYPSPAQSAAVEVALDALLHGGRYAVTGAGTRHRLHRTGAATSILGLARYMLGHSRQLAGPYRTAVSGGGAVVGEATGFTVTVTARRTGAPVPHLPVSLTVAGRTRTGTTNDAGAVQTRLTFPAAGPRLLRVVVARLPSDRLLVRFPARGHGSRVVVAGRKGSRRLRVPVAVRARPTLAVEAPATGRLPDPVPGVLRVGAGYPSPRRALVTLHGPFAAATDATCATAGTAAGTTRVTGDAVYGVPTLHAPAAGYYRWSARLAADEFNLAAWACGPPLLLRAVPTLSVTGSATRIDIGGRVRATVRAAGLVPGYADLVRVRLVGPYRTRAAARCDPGRVVRRRQVPVAAPGGHGTTSRVRVARPGFYAWQAVLPPAPLSTRVVTDCRAAGTLLRVG